VEISQSAYVKLPKLVEWGQVSVMNGGIKGQHGSNKINLEAGRRKRSVLRRMLVCTKAIADSNNMVSWRDNVASSMVTMGLSGSLAAESMVTLSKKPPVGLAPTKIKTTIHLSNLSGPTANK
jgi:hypothetical protein